MFVGFDMCVSNEKALTVAEAFNSSKWNGSDSIAFIAAYIDETNNKRNGDDIKHIISSLVLLYFTTKRNK